MCYGGGGGGRQKTKDSAHKPQVFEEKVEPKQTRCHWQSAFHLHTVTEFQLLTYSNVKLTQFSAAVFGLPSLL